MTLSRAASGQQLRQRGPEPILDDSEVLMREVVGNSLSPNQNSAVCASFRSDRLPEYASRAKALLAAQARQQRGSAAMSPHRAMPF